MRLLASALALASAVTLTPAASEIQPRWLSQPTRRVRLSSGARVTNKAQRKKARKAQTAARRNNRK